MYKLAFWFYKDDLSYMIRINIQYTNKCQSLYFPTDCGRQKVKYTPSNWDYI